MNEKRALRLLRRQVWEPNHSAENINLACAGKIDEMLEGQTQQVIYIRNKGRPIRYRVRMSEYVKAMAQYVEDKGGVHVD